MGSTTAKAFPDGKGGVVAKQVMRMTLSHDARVIDDALAEKVPANTSIPDVPDFWSRSSGFRCRELRFSGVGDFGFQVYGPTPENRSLGPEIRNPDPDGDDALA